MNQPNHSLLATGAQRYLLAEDDIHDTELITNMLLNAFKGLSQIIAVDCFQKALTRLQEQSFDALILDLNLPDQSGIENLHIIQQTHPDLPIIILTGNDDPELAIESLQSGAQDYIPKAGITPQLLLRALRYATQRKQMELELQNALRESAYRNKQLEKIAKHDTLTQLPNRTFFYDTAQSMLSRAARDKETPLLAVLYFDLNEFKKINDIYGHVIGDLLLQEVAHRAKSCLRKYDIIARMGGDEFVAIIDQLHNPSQAYSTALRIYQAIASPMTLAQHQINTHACIGIATYPESDSINQLIRHADLARYEAKKNRKNPIRSYSGHIEKRHRRKVEIEKNLPIGLNKNEFYTVYQPVIELATGKFSGVEALLRWHSNTLGHISPDQFIPVAEASDIIDHLTESLLKSVHIFHLSCQKEGIVLGKIAINIAARQLANVRFANNLLSLIAELGLPNTLFSIEVTERQLIQNLDICREQLEKLQANGIKISLDDFGTGFSSITHLMELPINYLKLDRKLIDHIDTNERNQALTVGVIEMAHHLNQQVIAEGIEREEEWRILRTLGCDHIQGYWVARPMSSHDLIEFFAHWPQAKQLNQLKTSPTDSHD